MVKLRSGKSAQRVSDLIRSRGSATRPGGPGSLLASLVARVQVTPVAAPSRHNRRGTSTAAAAIEAEYALADRSEAARLARHRRLARRESSPLPIPSEPVAQTAAAIWADVTGGAGVVLVDGKPLDIPVFIKGGGRP